MIHALATKYPCFSVSSLGSGWVDGRFWEPVLIAKVNLNSWKRLKIVHRGPTDKVSPALCSSLYMA